jgi:rod shape-determining protein MreD
LPGVLLILLSIVQLTVVPLIAIGSVIPDLVLILVVTYTLFFGQLFGTVFGAVSGLLFDLMSGGVIGSAMFSKTLSGFVAGYFYNENKIEYNTSTTFLLVIVFIAASLNSFFYLLITASEINLTASHLIIEQGILPGIYSALFSLPVIIINQKRGEL